MVIGILIALQINNWNNEQIRIGAEKVIIEQLIADLSKSEADLQKMIEAITEQVKASARVCHAFFRENVPNDSIYTDMRRPLGTALFSPALGTASSIVNSGNLTVIRSDELKNRITYYVEEVEYKLKDIHRYEETYFRNAQLLLKEVTQVDNLIPESDLFARTDGVDQSASLNSRNDEFRPIPNVVEKIPFKMSLSELFNNYKVFSAYNSFLVAHRNSANRYNDILIITSELLDSLQVIRENSR